MKQEKEIWRVTELTVAVHVPLEDPDYLKGLRKQQDELNESATQGRVGMIAHMEITYAAAHPDTGYSCSLQDLFSTTEVQPYASAPGAKEEFNGYTFSLTGCAGKPATKYRLRAIPVDADADINAFCIDESGTLKSIPAADSAKCFTAGQTVNTITMQPNLAGPLE
jgi:hypothetical protein